MAADGNEGCVEDVKQGWKAIWDVVEGTNGNGIAQVTYKIDNTVLMTGTGFRLLVAVSVRSTGGRTDEGRS